MSYSILVREYQSDHEIKLCEVGSNPDMIVKALREKKLSMRKSLFEGGGTFKISKYTTVRWVENATNG